jgi:hypothetical protein
LSSRLLCLTIHCADVHNTTVALNVTVSRDGMIV